MTGSEIRHKNFTVMYVHVQAKVYRSNCVCATIGKNYVSFCSNTIVSSLKNGASIQAFNCELVY